MGMKRVHFLKEFYWVPLDNPSITIRYPEAYFGEVEDLCALQAIADGAALEEEGLFAQGDEDYELFDPEVAKAILEHNDPDYFKGDEADAYEPDEEPGEE